MNLLWAFPIPQILLSTGLDREVSHHISNCKLHSLSFQVLDLKLLWRKSYRGSKLRNLFLKLQVILESHRRSQLCSLLSVKWCLYFDHTIQPHRDMHATTIIHVSWQDWTMATINPKSPPRPSNQWITLQYVLPCTFPNICVLSVCFNLLNLCTISP